MVYMQFYFASEQLYPLSYIHQLIYFRYRVLKPNNKFIIVDLPEPDEPIIPVILLNLIF